MLQQRTRPSLSLVHAPALIPSVKAEGNFSQTHWLFFSLSIALWLHDAIRSVSLRNEVGWSKQPYGIRSRALLGVPVLLRCTHPIARCIVTAVGSSSINGMMGRKKKRFEASSHFPSSLICSTLISRILLSFFDVLFPPFCVLLVAVMVLLPFPGSPKVRDLRAKLCTFYLIEDFQ